VELHPFGLRGRIVAHPWLFDLQSTGASDDLAARLVPVADYQALALLVSPALMLVEELTHLRFDGLLEHPLRSLPDQLIEYTASRELLLAVGHLQIDLANP
jgi:hypothetical protein